MSNSSDTHNDDDTAPPVSRTPVRHAEKRRTSTCRFGDGVAQVSVAKYKAVVPLQHQSWATCLATIVAHDANDGGPAKLTVVGLGVGTKFLSEQSLRQQQQNATALPYGDRIRDGHAEVLARRAFRRYLSLEMERMMSYTLIEQEGHSPDLSSILERVPTSSKSSSSSVSPQFRLRPGITLHFYTSSAPCGNAVLKKFATLRKEKFRDELGDDEWPTEPHEHMPWHSVNLGQFALLVKKDKSDTNSAPNGCLPTMSRHCTLSRKESQWPVNTSDDWCPPGMTTVWTGKGSLHSCSDKLCRWNCLGLQGSLLASLLERPLYLATLTVGRKLTSVCCRRAVCCRVDRDDRASLENGNKDDLPLYRMHHPAIMGTAVYLDETAVIDMSISKETGQDVRFHSPYSWVWWPGLGATAECIDGSTGWAVTDPGNATDDDISNNGKVCTNERSKVSTSALTDAYLEIQQEAKGSGPTTLNGLRELKKRASAEYEDAKELLLTRHPLLRQWKRREFVFDDS